jgi:hypothetical protein
MDGLDSLKKAQGIMMVAIALGVIALLMSVVKNVVTERWLSQKNTVACIPADVEHAHPLVYHQTASNPVQNDAYMKSFVYEYLALTLNENAVDYHQLTQNQRYDKARLSQSKWKSIEMSVGAERALNMERYADSDKVYKILDQGKMGWVFLVDDLLLFSGPNTGTTLVVVRGEFQVTFDKVKVDLPPRLWGYREIHLLIQQGVPVEAKDGESYINQYGLYVSWSNTNILTPEQKDKLAERNMNYYLMEEGK